MEYLNSLFALINEMSFYLLLGCLVAGILHVATPKSFYKKYLSQNNFKSVLYASLFGIPLPLCSCGVIPTAVSIYNEGASKGAAISFLTSTPQTGVDSILATYGVFGLPFAIIRPFIALITSLFSGVLVNKLASQKNDNNTENDDDCDCCNNEPEKKDNKIYGAIKYGFVDILQHIGGSIVWGLIIAGIITIIIPDSLFLFFNKNPFLEMLMVLIVAIPMYVCATGSIPIAAALILKGLSPGAALVFLMAGPATNIASLMVIGKIMGKRSMLIYLFVIIAFAFGFGFIINYFMPSQWFSIVNNNTQSEEMSSGSIFQWINSILFFLLLINAMILKRINAYKIKRSMKNQTVYKVSGMTCDHCKSLVENDLKKIDGISDAVVDLNGGYVMIVGNADEMIISDTINKLGFVYKGIK